MMQKEKDANEYGEKKEEKKRMRKTTIPFVLNEQYPDIPKKKKRKNHDSFVGYLNFPMKMRGKKGEL